VKDDAAVRAALQRIDADDASLQAWAFVASGPGAAPACGLRGAPRRGAAARLNEARAVKRVAAHQHAHAWTEARSKAVWFSNYSAGNAELLPSEAQYIAPLHMQADQQLLISQNAAARDQ